VHNYKRTVIKYGGVERSGLSRLRLKRVEIHVSSMQLSILLAKMLQIARREVRGGFSRGEFIANDEARDDFFVGVV